MTRFFGIALVGLSASLVACGGPTMVNGKAVLAPDKDSGKKGAGNVAVSKEAAATYDAALDQFCDAMIQIAQEAESDPSVVHEAPVTTPVRRLDQTKAAREPDLRWKAGS